MKEFAYLLVVFSLGMFVVGCGAKDEKKEEKKETKKDEAGDGVKVEGGATKEVNPDDIQLGKPDSNVENGDKPEKGIDNDDALPIDPPIVDPPIISPPDLNDTPETDTPGTDTPGTDTPETDTPELEVPGEDTPEVSKGTEQQ